MAKHVLSLPNIPQCHSSVDCLHHEMKQKPVECLLSFRYKLIATGCINDFSIDIVIFLVCIERISHIVGSMSS